MIDSTVSRDHPNFKFGLQPGSVVDFPTVIRHVLGESVAEVTPAVALDQFDIIIGKFDTASNTDKKSSFGFQMHSAVISNPKMRFSNGDQTSSNLTLYSESAKGTETCEPTSEKPVVFDFHYDSTKHTCTIELNAKGTYSEDFEFTKIFLKYKYDGATKPASSANWVICGVLQATAYQSEQITLEFDYLKEKNDRLFSFKFSDIDKNPPPLPDDFKLQELEVLVDLVGTS
ncbi:MAG: hypothetical protein AAF960_07765 [Bacteroidota bacterium]